MYRIEARDTDNDDLVDSFDTDFWLTAKFAQLMMKLVVWWYNQPISVKVYR